jgi:2-methylcitrate dehydratase PrpD
VFVASLPEDKMGVTSQLAEYVVGHSFSDIPEEVRALAINTIVDTIGCCIGGYAEAREECEWIVDVVGEMGGTPESSVFLGGFKTSAPLAALANGAMIHSVDFDDTHMGSISHFSASLVPTVFALAEKLQLNGPRLLEGFVVGFEVGARVGRRMMPSHYRYWHPTATFGSLACAAAAAKLLDLDARQTEYAVGLAADMAGGLRYCIDKGDFSKNLHPGFAAMRGVMFALLVKKGANGPRGLLEYPTGFCRAMSEDPKIEEIVQDLGGSYELTSNSLKAYPTILISHSSIEAVLALLRENPIEPHEIKKIVLRISRTAKGQGQNYHPDTPLAARLSIPFCVAMAALDREVSLTRFTRARLDDPGIKKMMARIEILEDASFNEKYPETLASLVKIETEGGARLEKEVIYPKGNIRNPMTRDDVAGKFRELCALSLDKPRCEEILQETFNLERAASVRNLADLLRG